LRIVIFTHSLVSDWNHGNAHFLRGISSELISRGHELTILEPENGWSLRNLLHEQGSEAISEFHEAYPELRSVFYDEATLDLNLVLDDADVVIVHEWNPHHLVARIGQHRATHGRYQLLFHDTHHRSLSDSNAMEAYDLRHFDGVLAYGNIIRDSYLRNGWARRAWTWHEAADTRIFHPLPGRQKDGDLVWIGNWGDDERADTLREFLIQPVKELGIRARVYGVRYPPEAIQELTDAGIEFAGWLPNYKVPEVFSRYRATVHIPRRPYVESLPGIPTIRPFEAMACGIPLVSAPWNDCEHLFRPGKDFLFAENRAAMIAHLRFLLEDSQAAQTFVASGLQTIRSRHTCSVRVDELLSLLEQPAEMTTTERYA
jgi:spore maturation protein CgeB